MTLLSELEFALRPVRQGDEAALSRFYHALSEQSRWYFEPWPDVSVEGMRTIVQWACEGRDISLIAYTSQNEIIAHLFIVHVEREIPHACIGILDAYHGLGLGRIFLTYLKNICRHDLKKEKLGLSVMKENVRAYRLYTALGFEIASECTFREEKDSLEMHVTL